MDGQRLVKVMAAQSSCQEEVDEFEAEITKYLNEGWRLLGPVTIRGGSILWSQWELSCTLIRHPHMVDLSKFPPTH